MSKTTDEKIKVLMAWNLGQVWSMSWNAIDHYGKQSQSTTYILRSEDITDIVLKLMREGHIEIPSFTTAVLK